MTHGPILIYIVGTWYIKQLLIHQILKGFTNMWVPLICGFQLAQLVKSLMVE